MFEFFVSPVDIIDISHTGSSFRHQSRNYHCRARTQVGSIDIGAVELINADQPFRGRSGPRRRNGISMPGR